MRWDDVEEFWFYPGRPPKLHGELFRRAVVALHDEDRLIAARFRSEPSGGRDVFPDEHPGLAYGFYETTLVYLVFRSWLDFVDVVWEARYSDVHARRADLFIRGEKLYFEAKWWPSMRSKVLYAMRADVLRLRDATDASGRYLLSFWWNHRTQAEHDFQAVVDLPRTLECDDLRPRYLARFPTLVKDANDAYFAFCVLEMT